MEGPDVCMFVGCIAPCLLAINWKSFLSQEKSDHLHYSPVSIRAWMQPRSSPKAASPKWRKEFNKQFCMTLNSKLIDGIPFYFQVIFNLTTIPIFLSARERLARVRSSLDLQIVRKFICSKTGQTKVVILLHFLGCGRMMSCSLTLFFSKCFTKNPKHQADDIYPFEETLLHQHRTGFSQV